MTTAATPSPAARASGIRRAAGIGEPPTRAQSRTLPADARVQRAQLRPGAAWKRKPVPRLRGRRRWATGGCAAMALISFRSPTTRRSGGPGHGTPRRAARGRPAEVGPHARREVELRVRALPQEKSLKRRSPPVRISRSDVGRRRPWACSEPAAKSSRSGGRRRRRAARGSCRATSSRPRLGGGGAASRRSAPRRPDRRHYVGAEPVPAPDHGQAHAVGLGSGPASSAGSRANSAIRIWTSSGSAAPVVGGEGVEVSVPIPSSGAASTTRRIACDPARGARPTAGARGGGPSARCRP